MCVLVRVGVCGCACGCVWLCVWVCVVVRVGVWSECMCAFGT